MKVGKALSAEKAILYYREKYFVDGFNCYGDEEALMGEWRGRIAVEMELTGGNYSRVP